MSKRNLIGGLALFVTGATASMAAMHLKVGFGPTASAAPPTVLAEAKPALPPPSKQQLSDARAVGHTFAQVASQLSPSVVRISITKSMKGMSRGMGPFHGSPFERFFGEGDDDERPSPKQKGTGSGVVIDG